MHIDKIYKGTLNGFNGVWCGKHPYDVTVTEEQDLLLPETGMILEHKETKEQQPCVILKSRKDKDNWTEIEEPKVEDSMGV